MPLHRTQAVLLGGLALILCGAQECEMSPTYAVTEADLVQTMTQRDANGNWRYGQIRFADWCDTYEEFYPVPGLGRDCHTQGVTVIGSQVVTSCQDDSGNVARLHVYERASFCRPPPTAILSLRTGALDHPVAGTGVDHYEYGDDGTEAAHTYYYPVVTTDVADKNRSAMVDIVDTAQSSVVCSFAHTGRSGDRTLGAASLVVAEGVTYLATCGWDCDDFYIYQLDLSSPSCGAQLRGSFDLKNRSSLRVDAGAGDENWGLYNGIALFVSGGDVFMIGTHHRFMDTWRIQGFGGASNGVFFRKLAKLKWDATWSGDGQPYFKQSLGIEQVTTTRLAIWLSPHDYNQYGGCGGGTCTRIYRCERELVRN